MRATRPSGERFLVTGAMGCLGAWTVRTLIDEGVPVVGLDASPDTRRLRLLCSGEDLESIDLVVGDITDPASLREVIGERGITNVVHLAALQVPFCKADPIRGAMVNVVGTVNVFEAVRLAGEQVRGISFASSVAVFGPPGMYPEGRAEDDSPAAPTTLYGVYKLANEQTARIYAQDHSVGSVGLRPAVVYGIGRDQGLTSAPTIAMLAAAGGEASHVEFGGRYTLQLASDVARVFIAAARLRTNAANIVNVGGPEVSTEEVVAAIEDAAGLSRSAITFDEAVLPVPALAAGALDGLIGPVTYTPLAVGVAETVTGFRRLLASGAIEAASTGPGSSATSATR